MTNDFNFTNILEYIPVRYTGLSTQQLNDRRAVYNFKDGNCSDVLKSRIASKIVSVTSNDPSQYVVCFIPASTQAKTNIRYNALASFLKNEIKCNVQKDAITVKNDTASGHIAGKKADPSADMAFESTLFSGKKVILVDDVITRGVSFYCVAERMMALGAKSVYGVFVAKTVHPNLPVGNTSYLSWEYEDILGEDFTLNDELQQELAMDAMQDELNAEALQDELNAEEIQEELYQDFMDDDFEDAMAEEMMAEEEYDY